MAQNILITGASGFVGSHLVDSFLADQNINVKIFATRRYHLSNREHSKHFEHRINWVDCNLQESISVSKMFDEVQPDVIFHCAAESFVSPSWNHPIHYMNVNYDSTVHLLDCLRRANSKAVIHIPGSGEEYGELTEQDLPINELTKLNPVNPYAVTKIAQDLISYVYFRSYNINVIRTRAFNHEGPRRENVFGISSYAHQIARIEQGLQAPVIETGDLNDRRNFTDVRDMVRAYRIAVEKCEPGKLYLVGTNTSDHILTFREILQKLIGKSTVHGITHKKVNRFTRPTNVPYLIADVSSFEKATGWAPKIGIDKMLSDILEYWRDRVRRELV